MRHARACRWRPRLSSTRPAPLWCAGWRSRCETRTTRDTTDTKSPPDDISSIRTKDMMAGPPLRREFDQVENSYDWEFTRLSPQPGRKNARYARRGLEHEV